MNGKRCVGLLMSFLFMFLMISSVSAAPAVTLTVGTVSARPGDTVTVPLSISDVSGLGAIGVHLYYDQAVLECVSATAEGIIQQMDTNTANTSPVNHPGEVWLTGMCLAGVSGSGTIMNVTFKVKSTAPDGLSTIGFTDEKQEIINVADATYMSETLVNGGVTVSASAAPQRTTNTEKETPATTAASTGVTPPTTTAPTAGGGNQTTAPTANGQVTEPSVASTGSASSEHVVTRNNGETVSVPQATMVDENGTVVTGVDGEPISVPGIAVLVDEVTAKPGEEVTVNVSLSAFSNIGTLGVDVSYDTEALSFVSATVEGVLKAESNSANVYDNGEGVVILSAMDPDGLSGNGVIASITFKVNASAKSGDYRLSLSPQPIFATKDGKEIPYTIYSGNVAVEGNGGSNGWIWVVIGVVAAAAVVTVIAVKAKAKKSNEEIDAEV